MMTTRRATRPAVILPAVLLLMAWAPVPALAQKGDPEVARDVAPVTATLVPAPPLRFPGDTDSNSPAVRLLVDGQPSLVVFNSAAGTPTRSVGSGLDRFRETDRVTIEGDPVGGIWLEAVVADADGTLYGYYHNEVVGLRCPGVEKAVPRIGAARSTDHGRSWQDLGVILETPPGTERCDTPNVYFVGGVGDFSVMLDHEHRFLYVFYGQYVAREEFQGVAVARMAWADRDEPVGRLEVWSDGVWLPPSPRLDLDALTGELVVVGWDYPLGTPIHPVARSWHDEDGEVDAFWGPSVHWNTAVERYVMLLNRASDAAWTQEGIYITFARDLADPLAWTPPRRLLEGGSWYPQVVGLEPDGTDKQAGATARFFMSGTSEFLLNLSM